MSKYEEIMNRVTVTPEMQERILKNIREGKRKNVWNARMPKYTGYIAAACLAMLLLGIGVLPRLHHGTQTTETTTEQLTDVFTIEELDSAKDLSDAAGFTIQDIRALPIEPETVQYLLSGGELAEIRYESGEQEICYRKAKGSDDISGIYEEYAWTEQESAGGREIALRGNGDAVYVATWTDDTYTYALSASQGVTREQMLSMAKEAAAQQ